jgi:cell division protein FtsL
MTPPAASHAHAAPPLAPRRRTAAPPRPRRVSGPARPAPAARPARAAGGLALGVAGSLDSLASNRLLDRLIRGRVWIGIVAFALIGIVTLQLGLLRLNSGIGRSLEREASLQRQNAALSVENSELAAGSRVESQAEQLGMRLVSVGGLQFLGSHARADISHALAALAGAPSHEAAKATTAAAAVTGEEPTHESGAETSSESSSAAAAGTSSSPAAAGASEASHSSETTPAPSATPTESATTGAGTEAKSETSGEPVPAGQGGGAAAPGG